MLGALQEPLIKSTCILILLLLDFKVNIRLPEHLPSFIRNIILGTQEIPGDVYSSA